MHADRLHAGWRIFRALPGGSALSTILPSYTIDPVDSEVSHGRGKNQTISMMCPGRKTDRKYTAELCMSESTILDGGEGPLTPSVALSMPLMIGFSPLAVGLRTDAGVLEKRKYRQAKKVRALRATCPTDPFERGATH